MNAPFPEGEKIRFWYGGKKGEHWQYSSAGLGTGTLRRDGFVSWETKEEGYIVTCPLKINWATTIFLNIEAPKGAIEVEVLDAKTNKPLPGVTKDDCLPITGNHLRAPVEFKNERGRFLRHTGEIKFKFYLKNAKIYAFKTTGVSF